MRLISLNIKSILAGCFILLLAFVSFGYTPKKEAVIVSREGRSVSDCIVCERIELFSQCRKLVGDKIWPGLNYESHIAPLLYFSDDSTYIAWGSGELFPKYQYDLIECPGGLWLMKLGRMDTLPFHMQNKMNFSDSTSVYYYRPMMLCSGVESLLRLVPDFNKTEDWLQLVMHEYFHSFQFSYKATMKYFADTIRMSADTLDRIYIQNKWFQEALEKENLALLNAIRTGAKDSLDLYIAEFRQIREQRRKKYESSFGSNLSAMENFWETIEGTARYAEYYMAGNFNQVKPARPVRCDSLFRNFKDYTGTLNFEDKPEFRQRTKIMEAYYYVTGFNICRLMDKMNILYKPNLFNVQPRSVYEIFSEHTRH